MFDGPDDEYRPEDHDPTAHEGVDHDTCKACGAAVLFLLNADSGKANILDRDPVENGNVAIVDGKAMNARKNRPLPDGAQRYISHFATCPDAGKIRAELAQRTRKNDQDVRTSW